MMVKLLSVPSFRAGVVMFKVVSFGLKQKKKKNNDLQPKNRA
jgi:hypothetical protein